MLDLCYKPGRIEAGCDEAGRGCLAGPVFAAAVVLPENFQSELLNDSKKLNARIREKLREQIEAEAVSFALGVADEREIEEINILNASILAMHRALDQISTAIDFVLIDGNRFKPWGDVPHSCFVGGDGRYASIAAASILAKTHRDKYMKKLHNMFPVYAWDKNVGYPTRAHRQAIREHGPAPAHRRTFRLLDGQMSIDFS